MDDPRRFPPLDDAPPAYARLFALAAQSQGASTGQHADACDAELAAAIDAMLRPGADGSLAALFDAAPSAAVYRHLWRILAQRERAGAFDSARLVRVFALPVIVVAGAERADSAGTVLPCVLGDASALAGILRDKGALAGNRTIAFANTLVAADVFDFDRLPQLLAIAPSEAIAPSPIVVSGTSETVHLRFLVGTALAAAGADLFRDRNAAAWGTPFAQALSGELAAPGISVLALPRAPLPLVEAAWQGRLAQREVGAQIFASNAIRALRAATGEPSAVISMHASEADTRGGEVRLSLSSPFDPRSAEGFRCPLAPLDSVEDVVAMLLALLADCRVVDVRRKPGVHPDRDAATGLPLLFKAEGAPPAAALH